MPEPLASLPLVDLRGAAFAGDKYAEIARLRRLGDLHPIQGGHVCLSQESAVEVLKCRDFRFDFFQIDPNESPYLAASIEHELLNMHGGPHARLQKTVLAALRDKVMDGLRDQIRGVAEALIDAWPDAGQIDFCKDFADPYPANVLGPMFDLPYADIDGFDDWIRLGGRKVDALQSGEGVEAVEQAVRNMHGYLADMLGERRKNPGTDIFSELMLAKIDGDQLSETELLSLVGEMASAGVDTTRSQLPLILEQLLLHADQFATLRADPSRAMDAVNEGMRMAPLPWALPHRALMDRTLAGAPIKAGQLMMVLIPAVNRDPAHWSDPDAFDITRPRQRNFSFGYGMHSCPGAQLARMEMAIALETLLERVTDITLIDIPTRDPVQKGAAPTQMQLSITKNTTIRR